MLTFFRKKMGCKCGLFITDEIQQSVATIHTNQKKRIRKKKVAFNSLQPRIVRQCADSNIRVIKSYHTFVVFPKIYLAFLRNVTERQPGSKWVSLKSRRLFSNKGILEFDSTMENRASCRSPSASSRQALNVGICL